MTKSGSVDHEITDGKVKEILVSQTYRWEQQPPNQSQSPGRQRQYTPPKHNEKPLQYNAEV
jgi:hypothetical protein